MVRAPIPPAAAGPAWASPRAPWWRRIFAATDRLIREELHSDVALINQLGEYLMAAGGKRLRPLVVLLAARACGIKDDRHIELAAIIEFIHTATLLHDDVVDGSACAAAARPPTPSGATRPACSPAISSTPAPSR